MLKSSPPAQEEEEDPLAYYENHTSQIEVRQRAPGVGWEWRGPLPGVTSCHLAD